MHIRISATDIDSYRRFRADEEMTLEAFLADMQHWTPATPAMKAGTALHKALEHAEPRLHSTLKADDYVFLIEFSDKLDLPDIRECKGTRRYLIGDVVATVVGKVDAILGTRIDDHKFTARWDAERFLGSYQWRIYLEIFEADEFRWNVFEGREVPGEIATYKVSGLHSLRTFRYPGMGADVANEIGLFVEFARRHLPERFTPEAA